MTGTILIAGASGLVGSAAALEFLDAGWKVVAISRRRPEWLEGRDYVHLPLDLQDADACADAAARLTCVTHVLYAAVYEMPGLIAGWTDPHQIETNGRMLRNLMDPLLAHAAIEHVSLLQGLGGRGYAAHRPGGTVSRRRLQGRE